MQYNALLIYIYSEESLNPCVIHSLVSVSLQVSGPVKQSASPAGRAGNVLDTMTMSNRKPAASATTGSKQNKALVLKPLVPRPKSKVPTGLP